jgi:polar amino acid transport system substrate-binding protein
MHANRFVRASRMLLALLCLAGITAAGCQSSTHGSSSRLEKILASGELRVGLTADQPPLNMRNKAGEMIGLEIDMMRALSDAMGLEARFVPMPFSDLLTALEKGKVDVVASGVTITPERNARVAFAGPYFITGKSVLSKSEKISSVESVSELDVAGRTYAALAGSTSEKFIRESLPNATLVTTENY